ncbi:prepilin-type N-terminal cleavage/methylation domain-containing protein [Luteimonas sp BLCC-B24]|uniref:type II secretion system protein n=1 Tax=Luteimonas sp. BLCC-B24 TaxID=3025317 RepID=UPI00234CB0F1|nr:prepilin-type N-terminal cleavage/methylation domain-containing protein [Luteimonas sp. BLCC-B24]MDC7805927.1 prepilin-type N-terminal cleavage/methylation domain-containing protein [Luteimonas sp. BLCC-B24]
MSPRTPLRPPAPGFTLIEMSVVLVVIALIIGAVSVGRDVYRSAVAERIGSEFVQGWMIAYDRYVQQVGVVPGDDMGDPTGEVNGAAADELLCGDPLRDAMLVRGIALPQGRAERQETRYVYQDSRGNPQQLEVCFLNVGEWAEPGPGTTYVNRRRNVMRLTGMTPELANQLDTRIDGRVNARAGRMRQQGLHTQAAAGSGAPDAGRWTLNDLDTYGGGTSVDGQVAVMAGYIRMNQ